MKKVYLYKKFERFWHWGQTVLVLTLIVTGFEIHGTTNFMGFEQAVKIHDIAAWAFLILIVFAIFWHLTTNEFKQYLPTAKNLKAQLNYYLTGIFANAPHPTRKRTLSKLNPLQRITYFALKIILIPVMVVSGLLYMYFDYPELGIEMESLGPIALIHTLGSYLLLTFLIIHLYLITTGHTVTSNLEAMITGWETVEDEDVKDIVEEVIDETRQRIRPLHQDSKGEEELKKLVVEALNEKGQHSQEEKTEVAELSHQD
jgi:thiosulfate reductase cytochrome b subunit